MGSGHRLEAAATVPPSDDLEERFWGPDPVTSVEAVVADLREQFSHRRQMAADSIDRDAAAELLGTAAQSVTARLDSRKLVGIKVGREWRLPRWQFAPDNISGVLPDPDILQEAFPGRPVAVDDRYEPGHRLSPSPWIAVDSAHQERDASPKVAGQT